MSNLDVYDYIKRYENPGFKDFLRHIFMNHSILFLGYSFLDRELLEQLAIAKQNNNEKTDIIHFALIPEDNEHNHIQEIIFEEVYNIKIIKYGPKDVFDKKFKTWVELNFGGLSEGEEQNLSDPNR